MRAIWRRRTAELLPPGWTDIVRTGFAHWQLLDDAERTRLGELMEQLLGQKRWEAARGFQLTDEMRVIIAAQASLVILGLDIGCYRDIGSIIVHPTTMTSRGPRPGPARGVVTDEPMLLLGQAHDRRGPVVVAWDAAQADARHPERGHNVVFHEFAHKLDMLDNLIDGTPPLPEPSARQRWIEVCTAEFQLLRAGRSGGLLRGYAATNPAEFFAVATEVFFDLPREMRAEKPALYEVLQDFYLQDPAHRATRQPFPD